MARGIEKEKESTLSLWSRVENEISKTDEADCAGGRWWRFYRRRGEVPSWKYVGNDEPGGAAGGGGRSWRVVGARGSSVGAKQPGGWRRD